VFCLACHDRLRRERGRYRYLTTTVGSPDRAGDQGACWSPLRELRERDNCDASQGTRPIDTSTDPTRQSGYQAEDR
jgi:hypothetical protein